MFAGQRLLKLVMHMDHCSLRSCRAASALQEAAAEHKKRTGRPFVLIIDAVDRLAEHAPDILETLQVLLNALL